MRAEDENVLRYVSGYVSLKLTRRSNPVSKHDSLSSVYPIWQSWGKNPVVMNILKSGSN